MPVSDTLDVVPWIEFATIVAVDRQRRTVDIVTDQAERRLHNVPIASPVFSQTFGEGMNVMPEPGARAVVCLPSDRQVPIILGFIADPNESDESEDDSYQGGLPDSQREEIVGFRGRKGNRVSLFRDGTVLIQAKPGVQRLYIPGGTLWDVASRYKVDTAQGHIEWKAEETDKEARFIAVFKAHASDPKPSVGIRVGFITDSPVTGPSAIDVAISPSMIGDDGSHNAETFAFRVDHQGNSYQFQQGTMTQIVNGHVTMTAVSKSETIQGSFDITVLGSKQENVIGASTFRALRIEFDSLSEFLVAAPVIRLGSPAAVDPCLKGLETLKWLATHTHPSPKTPPQEIDQLPSILSTSVFTDPR